MGLLVVGLATPALSDHQEITVHVKGMVCAFCSQGLTKKFNKEKYVSKVDVNLDKKIVKVNLKHDAGEMSDEYINELITQSGFNVDKIERTVAKDTEKAL